MLKFAAMEVKNVIPGLLRQHRKKAGLSREQLAALAGVGKTVIYDIEHGKETIRFDTLLRILESLNIKLVFDTPLMGAVLYERS